jgi:hypothetical protein
MRGLRSIAICALMTLCVAAPAATYRVGAGGACTHASIQDAIDAAAADPDVADTIRVTRSLAYQDVSLDIHDQSLVITGGYAYCDDEIGDGLRTELAGDGDNSVVRIHGDGDVTLRYLTLSGGHQPRFNYGFGGGLHIEDGPHLVTTSDLLVTNNDAGHGGGISVVNEHSDMPADVKLTLGDNVVVSYNEAGYPPVAGDPYVHGGGIYCKDATLVMNGGSSTSILGNVAEGDGGGIAAVDCDVTIAPRGTFGSFNGIVLNEAGRDGGGLLAAGDTGIDIYTAHAQRPVYIAANTAGREGGGLKLNSGARVNAWDVIIEGNRSFDEGGAVSVFSDYDASGLATFIMQGTTGAAPPDAVNCDASRRCNRIADNVAADDGGNGQDAAAIRVKTTDNEVFGEAVRANVQIRGTLIDSNAGASLVRIRQECDFSGTASADVDFHGVVMSRNSVSGRLLTNPDAPYDCSSNLTVHASTIAGNDIGGDAVIGSTDHFLMDRSIVWQPGRQAVAVGGLDEGDVEYVLASDLTGIPASITDFSADPRFVDPERGDFHLQASSPAIDFAPANTEAEADDMPRSRNLALVPDDGFGPQDLGAYELQSIGNLVRNDGFEFDLHIWTNAAPAATSWNPYDRAGSTDSGSLEVYDTSAATRVVALSQCVGIPGPGFYRLDGYGWSWEELYPPIPDHPILAWVLHRDGGDCAGATIDSGEAQAPASGGWRAIPAQFIVVGAGDWTPGTTLEVQLIQEKTDNPLGGDTDAILFDDIALVPDDDVIFADGFGP